MISFTIPFRLPSLNEYIDKCRGNRYGGANFKKSVENNIMLILNTRKFLIVSPVHITFVWHEPNKKRDKDNVAFAKKFILDALQKSGRLQNDNNRYIEGFTDKFVYDGTEGVEVYINRRTEDEQSRQQTDTEPKDT